MFYRTLAYPPMPCITHRLTVIRKPAGSPSLPRVQVRTIQATRIVFKAEVLAELAMRPLTGPVVLSTNTLGENDIKSFYLD